MRQSLTLQIPVDGDGLTLKTLYDICTYAEEHYKELRGIRPLQRVEAGFGFPRKEGDDQTYYKAKFLLGWNRGRSTPQYCRWNLIVPDNWKDELPMHRLFNTTISNSRPAVQWTCVSTWENRMREMEEKSDYFAWCQGKGLIIKKNKIIATLDCGGDMPKKMFSALKSALKDMGYILA